MVRGGGGDQNNDMAGYENFVYILGRGKNKIGPVLGVISMQFSSMYKIQNGDSLGVAKILFLFIYLFLN